MLAELPHRALGQPPEETLDEIITALESGDTSFKALYLPLGTLSRLPIDAKRRDEVARLLDPLVMTEQSSVRRAAQRAIMTWGTSENVPTLLKLLEWQDRSDRHAAIDALASIGGSKEAAEAIAALMVNSDDRVDATRALKEMGPIAEEAVWQHIGSEESMLHYYACQVLGKVGTSKTLVKLKRRKERDNGRKAAVNSAIRDIERRLVKR